MPAFLILLIIALAGRISIPASPMAAERTTADGVYTAAQAQTGATVFEEACQTCHVPGWERVVGFYGKWHGKPLAELMTYVRREMPQTDPGSLTPEEYGQVTAYLLRLTRMPAGAEMLNPDPAALREIRIDSIPSKPR
jgi:S-disulfanyl-L-cysteine oxidoreductase SoxD